MSEAPRAIGVVSVSRSDYGHLRPVLAAIRSAPDLALRLFVGGMHLAPAFGLTVREIETDGWSVAERVEMLDGDDSPEGVARAIGRGTAGFARAYARQRPSLLLLLGDRFEMLAAATAALPFGLPVAHLHGGEVTEGAMDNQIRHAITKLAHLHLTSAEEHTRRILAMGEEAWRVHTVGAPGLDRFRGMMLLSRAELARQLGLPSEGRWLLVTFPPVTLEDARTGEHIDELLAALDKVDAALAITYPNADTGGRLIIDRLEEFAARRPRARLVPSLGEQAYVSLLRHADAMVGNSSSGLIEAPSFGLPVVNIGSRQRGRLRGPNVIDVGEHRDEILAAIARALAPGLKERLAAVPNPYGDGQAAPRILRVLRETPLDQRLIQKR
jgi:UDP-hydrolysing UDP-N-acetyl-D-glucosamine 2-epimerase